ncbi:MAG: MerC domain-containing protein [Gammaproteobacteria bacterium]|nr:MerC domain-containing protein [Gammaproteobacteria bacterium]
MYKQIGGSIGSIFASICCLGFAPILAALSAAGLGFMISDAILIPLLAFFLILALWGMKSSQKRHGKTTPFYVGVGGAIAAFVGILVFMPVHIIGLITLVSASIWDIVLLRKPSSSHETTSK